MINGDAIRDARKAKGWSQTVLAKDVEKLCGEPCSQQAIAKIESGGSNMSAFLPYICISLDLEIGKVDPVLEGAMMMRSSENLLQIVNQMPPEMKAKFLQDAIALQIGVQSAEQ